jgi:hypothetical protein
MPTTVTEYAQSAQEQTLGMLREGQQAFVHAVNAWAESVEQFVPTSRLSFGDQVPSATEIVQSNFDFAEQLLKSQREFVESLVAATAPVLPARAPKATRAAAKPSA